ncbi:hypothetical protein ACO0QE_003965 [Hanseniaspora vineae]
MTAGVLSLKNVFAPRASALWWPSALSAMLAKPLLSTPALQSSANTSGIGVSLPLEKLKEMLGISDCADHDHVHHQQLEQDFFSNNGILRAVPKKKMSLQKRRSRQLAPARKQEKYINHLNRCPSCGHYKRSHTVCMNCFVEVRDLWTKFMGKPAKSEPLQNEYLTKEDKTLLYSNRKPMDFEKSALRRKNINEKNRLMNRNARNTLPVEPKK